jgi:glycerophosphoryl diester phosphodiesterase
MNGTPRLYAHRGAAVELPENTLEAFERAIELGADAIETDAHLTRDGHVVLSHDPRGARMCGVDVALEDASLDEVRTWDAGARFASASGARATKAHRIPTLDEALAALPGVPFNVDAKSRHSQMVPRLLEAIARANAEDHVLVASFDARTLRDVRAHGYRGKTGLAQTEVLRLLGLPRALLALFPLRGAAAQIPYRTHGVDLGTRAMIDKCHALGLEVHYWTVNEAPLAERLLAAGADAIMTDDPRTIAPVFAKRRAKG